MAYVPVFANERCPNAIDETVDAVAPEPIAIASFADAFVYVAADMLELPIAIARLLALEQNAAGTVALLELPIAIA